VAYQCGVGFSVAVAGRVAIGCTADDCTGDGFALSSAVVMCVNCVSTDNGGYGFNASSANTATLINCAAGVGSAGNDNTSGATNLALHVNLNFKTITGNPYTGALDWRPDDTANEGALLRGNGIDVYGQTDNRDIGAVQHADPAGGGGGGSCCIIGG
jgi:hypothetical protein